MKTTILKTDWLAPLVGLGVVAGCLMAGTAYLSLEQKRSDADAKTATLDRLYQDLQLSMVLKQIHNGELNGATQRLDTLLCQNIRRLDEASASADSRTRTFVEDAFRRIGRTRPMVAQGGTHGSGQGYTDEQLEAERILTRLMATPQTAQAR